MLIVVRHTPLTATESPLCRSAVTVRADTTMRAPESDISTEAADPNSSMMPVNKAKNGKLITENLERIIDSE
jgi:hypothetical protein